LSAKYYSIHPENPQQRSIAQVAEIGAELKKYAKSIDGSSFVRNQRKE
jgi:hypothetical protein